VIYSMANAKQHSLVGQNLWFDQTPLNYYDWVTFQGYLIRQKAHQWWRLPWQHIPPQRFSQIPPDYIGTIENQYFFKSGNFFRG
jgi:hypothetical protein